MVMVSAALATQFIVKSKPANKVITIVDFQSWTSVVDKAMTPQLEPDRREVLIRSRLGVTWHEVRATSGLVLVPTDPPSPSPFIERQRL
jgi:hypothetical protein